MRIFSDAYRFVACTLLLDGVRGHIYYMCSDVNYAGRHPDIFPFVCSFSSLAACPGMFLIITFYIKFCIRAFRVTLVYVCVRVSCAGFVLMRDRKSVV